LIVVGIDPANPEAQLPSVTTRRNTLLLRVLSSLVLAPIALGAAYYGSYLFIVFWAIAAIGVLWEWDALVCAHDKNSVFTIGCIALLGATLLWAINRPIPMFILIGLGMLGVAALASRVRRTWCVVGLFYAAVLLAAPLVLRSDPSFGFWAIAFVFGIVWATDVGAYVAGRALGGPKLLLRVSPNKTWSGAIAGLFSGLAGGFVVARLAGMDAGAALIALALVLSVVSQFGDLFESAVKRRFNAKDSSSLIPGHGGVMDRLDGFVVAALTAAIVGVARGGVDTPGRGLLVW
jgi:phosphatidate cytidylyltransferase